MKVSLALAVLPLALAAPAPHGKPAPKIKYPGLNALAKKAGLLYFGTAIDNVAQPAQYVAISSNNSEFGQVTPANGQKWMYIEPEQNVFNFTMGDQIINTAIKNKQLRRCHNFVWHNQLPNWITAQNWTKTELTNILENHIKNEARHYWGECYAWDVVNEAYNEDGTYREDVFYNTLGPKYIEMAFKFARKYTSPGTKLYYNDYNIETLNNKSLSVAAMVKDFNKRGIPIDGVGLQSHFITGSSPSYDQLSASIAQFNNLGKEVALTELDVRSALPDSDAEAAQQAKDYASSVKACVDAKKCVGVTVWDFWDPVSWVPSTFPGQGDADLWSANFTKKPAYYSISDVLIAAA